jgi:hypothetical protein
MGTLPEGANQEVTLTYYLAIPYSLATAPTLAKSGAYVDTFDIKVYEGDDPLTMETPVVSTSVTLTITVDPMIDLSLVSSGGSFDISKTTKTVDMGNLYQGLSRTFDMRVRTNAGYSVTFSSDNNGNLKAAGVASLIPYSFYVNAVLLNMSNSKAVPVVGLSGAGSTDLQGLSYPIRMVIGNMGATTFYGGNHQDTVTITATTTE